MKQVLNRWLGIAIVTVVSTLPSIAQNSWKALLSGAQNEWGNAICAASNGDVVVVGGTYSNDGDFAQSANGNGDVFIVRYNAAGRMVWKKQLVGSEMDWGASITPLNDGSFVVTGETQSNDGDFRGLGQGKQDIFILRISESGSVVWLRTIGGSSTDRGVSTALLADGSIVVAGNMNSNDGSLRGLHRGGDDFVIMRLKSDGNIVWKRSFGGSDDDRASSVCVDWSNSIYVTGYSNSSDGDFKGLYSGKGDAFVLKLDNTGERIWLRKFGGSNEDWGTAITAPTGGGIVVIGETNSSNGIFTIPNRGKSDIFAIKIDSLGQLLWLNTYGGSGADRPLSISMIQDQNILISGCSTSNDGDFVKLNRGKEDMFVISINPSGNLVWKATYGGSGHDWGTGIKALPNDVFVLTGYTNSKDGDFISRASMTGLDHDDAVVIRSTATSAEEDDSPIRYSDVVAERDAQRFYSKGTATSVDDFSMKTVFGGTADDWVTGITTNNESGTVLVGYSSSSDGAFKGMNEGGEDVVLLNVDAAGNTLWRRSYGGSANDRGLAVTPTLDGGYAVTGQTTSGDGDFRNDDGVGELGDLDVYVLKTKPDGKSQWVVKFGGPKRDRGQAVLTSQDGSIMVAGVTNSESGIFKRSGQDDDIFLARVDGEGAVWWVTSYGGSDVDWVASMVRASDSGFVLVGYTKSNDRDFAGMNHGKSDIFVMKLDPQGRNVWTKTYGGSGDEWGLSIAQSPRGGYILSGYTTSNDGDFKGLKVGQHDGFVMYIDDNGNIAWKQVLGGTASDVASGVTVKPSGKVVVTGHTSSNDGTFAGLNHGQEDIFVAVYDAQGKLLQKSTYGGTANDRGIAVTSPFDTGFTIAAQSFSDNGDFEGMHFGQVDMQLLRLNSNGTAKKRK